MHTLRFLLQNYLNKNLNSIFKIKECGWYIFVKNNIRYMVKKYATDKIVVQCLTTLNPVFRVFKFKFLNIKKFISLRVS